MAGSIYLSPRQNVFKVISRRIDGELSKIAHSRRNVRGNGLQPCIIESTLKVVDRIAKHEGNVNQSLAVSKIVFDRFKASIRISLDSSNVGVWQRGNSGIDVSDVLIRPFDFKSGISK